MARQVTHGMARSMRSHPAQSPDPTALRRERQWGRIAYIVGFGMFALGFVGMAVSVTTGSEALVVVCIAVVVLGGIAAGIGLHRMYGHELRQLLVRDEDGGDHGDGGGGWGRGRPPEETPPGRGGTPPGEEDQPSWWPAFEHSLKEWSVAGSPDRPGGLETARPGGPSGAGSADRAARSDGPPARWPGAR